MTDARIYTTRAGAQRLSDAMDAATDSGRRYTQDDLVKRDEDGAIISGTVSYSGGGRHVAVEDMAAKPWAHIVESGGRFAYPWSAEVARHSDKPNVPDAPNGTIDETWTPVAALEVERDA